MKTHDKTPLSEHFTLYEFTRSGAALDHSLDNTPDARQRQALADLCTAVLEPLRRRFGPIVISSGFRTAEVNRLVGGVPTSQHMAGEAADIVVGSPERGQLMYRYVRTHLDFDQLISEPRGSQRPRWLHVSYRRGANRHEAL